MSAPDQINEHLRGLVDASGFAFQLALEHTVKAARLDWKVLLTEHAWQHPTRPANGFIDAVLESGAVRLVVECKRRTNAQWVFLAPKSSKRVEVLWTGAASQSHAKAFDSFYCTPESPECAFCAVRDSGEDRGSMLERVAGPLLDATEALAHEQLTLDRGEAEHNGSYRRMRFYVPVIVTNATLLVSGFNVASVDLATGRLPPDATFEEVPVIRFFKNLTTSEARIDLEQTHLANNRTMLVVNAMELCKFLEAFSVSDQPKPSAMKPFL